MLQIVFMLSCINVTLFTGGNDYLSVKFSVNLKQTIKCKNVPFNLIKFIKITGCTKPPVCLFTITDHERITVRSLFVFYCLRCRCVLYKFKYISYYKRDSKENILLNLCVQYA